MLRSVARVQCATILFRPCKGDLHFALGGHPCNVITRGPHEARVLTEIWGTSTCGLAVRSSMTSITPRAWKAVTMILLPRSLGLRRTPAVPSYALSISISTFVSVSHVSAIATTLPPLLASSSLAVLISSTDRSGPYANRTGNTTDSEHMWRTWTSNQRLSEATVDYTLGSWDFWGSWCSWVSWGSWGS